MSHVLFMHSSVDGHWGSFTSWLLEIMLLRTSISSRTCFKLFWIYFNLLRNLHIPLHSSYKIVHFYQIFQTSSLSLFIAHTSPATLTSSSFIIGVILSWGSCPCCFLLQKAFVTPLYLLQVFTLILDFHWNFPKIFP